MTASQRRVLCLSGSLRRVSSNRAALEAARELASIDTSPSPDTPSPQRKLGSSDLGGVEPKGLDSCLTSPSAVESRRNDGQMVLELQLYDGLGSLPPFNPDDEHDLLPPSVLALREAVGRADALLIASPEYAHGVSGVFKNLLDWLVGSLEFPGKPVLLLNTAARGSHHAQEALAEVLSTMSARLLAAQPVMVPLPGAGCTAAQVLASTECRVALHAALDILADIPPHP
jgi:NAD(P)H-dependent FMN reductase